MIIPLFFTFSPPPSLSPSPHYMYLSISIYLTCFSFSPSICFFMSGFPFGYHRSAWAKIIRWFLYHDTRMHLNKVRSHSQGNNYHSFVKKLIGSCLFSRSTASNREYFRNFPLWNFIKHSTQLYSQDTDLIRVVFQNENIQSWITDQKLFWSLVSNH